MTSHPGPAEIARSIAVAAPTLHLETHVGGAVTGLGMHVTDCRGRLLVPVAADSLLGEHLTEHADIAGRALLVDVAPVAVRQRERARLELLGWLEAVPAHQAHGAWASSCGGRDALEPHELLLRLDPQEIVVRIPEGRVLDVEPEAYGQTAPDPLALHEAEVLQHLVAGHVDALGALTQMLPAWALKNHDRVVPLRLNRFHLVLRVEKHRRHHDIALPLGGEEITTAEQVLTSLRSLLCCGRPQDAAASEKSVHDP